MPRKKVFPFLTEPLFLFIDSELTKENYHDLLVEVINMGWPSKFSWAETGTRTAGVTLVDAKLMQKTFRADLERWIGDGFDPMALSWEERARHTFQRAILELMPPWPVHSKALPTCAVCPTRFTPLRPSQTTCSKKCYEHLRRKRNLPRKTGARLTRTSRYAKRAESQK
jgi:predicted nucleic acid-binding Zn ribbon protein